MPPLLEQMASSPLPYLIAEEQRGDGQAREALFCSFGVDLGYFEQSVLGVAEATGARVTVLADARAAEPAAAPRAGTGYVHGLAVPRHGGAFHARVAVVAGRERALVAIGSGDLSPGGWGLNKESWTVATADRAACPELVADVADWLRSLDGLCALTPLAANGIARTATLLEELAVASDIVDTGHRLVHTSTRPIADQLPRGDVDHLLLYAPAHDERTAAVAELIARLRPARVTLMIAPGGRTVIQPAALRRVIAAAGAAVTVVEDSGSGNTASGDTAERFRHETLVEAVAPDGSRWVLTGSPELSVRALFSPAAGGGGIEVGVIARPAASLFPPTTRALSVDEVPAARLASSGQDDGVVLLSAARSGDGASGSSSGLEVVLARPAAWPTALEAARPGGVEAWEAIGSVPAGAGRYVLAGVDLPGGTRVRSAGGGAPVFVLDPELVLLRGNERAAASQPGPAELIADAQVLENWLAAAAGHEPQAEAGEQGWLAYADDASASLGAAMFGVALGELPAGWAGSAFARARELPRAERRKVRQLLEAAVGQGEDTGAAGVSGEAGRRLALLVLVLCAAEAGMWDGPDGADGWVGVCARALTNLAESDIPPQLATGAASWAALAVYLMHERRRDGGAGTGRTASGRPGGGRTAGTAGRSAAGGGYEEARAAAGRVLPSASAELVADLAAPFTNDSGFPVDPDAVMHVTGLVAQDDPVAEAIDALASAKPDWSVHRHGERLLHVESGGRGTFLHAAEAIERVPGDTDVAAWATGSTPAWAIAVRFEGALIHVESDARGQVLWRHYRLGPLAGPTGLARNPELASRSRVNHGALKDPFPDAIRALVATGVDLTGGTPSDCPD